MGTTRELHEKPLCYGLWLSMSIKTSPLFAKRSQEFRVNASGERPCVHGKRLVQNWRETREWKG